ncbi:MAG: peptidylprolyl isomerase [Pseudomonadota bacterium]
MLIPRLLTIILSIFAVVPGVSQAQNLFAPIYTVNEDVVTEYEIQQRQRFFSIISPANSSRESVEEDLIDEKLRQQAVRRAGVSPALEDIEFGMAEFAGRANLSVDEFVRLLAQDGVAAETLRDFVAAGLGWRDLIRARYGARVQITPADIDRALAASSEGGGVRVLLSEIIMPAPPQEREAVLARAERIAQSQTTAEFSAFARQFSATASRGRGGRLNWTPVSQLPAAIRGIILQLSPGEVTSPLPIPNAVALFQLRAIEETDAPAQEYSSIEYAEYLIPGGRSSAALAQASDVISEIDVCDDLYGVALGEPEEYLVREAKTPENIPQDVAIELAKLDENEVSTALTTADGQFLRFIMLCGRTSLGAEDLSRDAVAEGLRQRRLNGLADSFVEQLRAEARIVRQ